MVKQTQPHNQMKSKVHFESISMVDKTPKIESICDREFIMVVYREKPFWALFRCPCGCGRVFSLPLLRVHYPNWKVCESLSGRPTVYPSVRQNNGCYSHFWIEDGKVLWCRKMIDRGHQNRDKNAEAYCTKKVR